MLVAPCINNLGLFIFLLSTQEPRTIHGDSPKTKKLAKDKANLKATTPFSRNRKSVLTQNLSLPARGGRFDVTNKSIDVYPVKREAKHAQRHVTSSLNHPNSPASAGIPSKDAKTVSGASGRRYSSASMPSIGRTVVAFSFFVFSFVSSVWSFPYSVLK